MSFLLMQRVIDADTPRLSSSDKLLLLALARFADDAGRNCYPSLDRLHHMTRMSLTTIRSSFRRLAAEGYATSHPRPGSANLVELNVARLEPADGNESVPSESDTPTKSSTPIKSNRGTESDRGTPTKSGRGPLPNLVPEDINEEVNKKNKKSGTRRQRVKLPHKTIPLSWWIAAETIRPKQLKPWVVFDEFRRYWLSDHAVRNGLNADWNRTWDNNVRNLRQTDANRWEGYNGEYQQTFERLYRGTPDEQQAERFFAEKTSISDFGHGAVKGLEDGDLFDSAAEARNDAKAAATVRAVMRSGKAGIGVLKNKPAAEEEWDGRF